MEALYRGGRVALERRAGSPAAAGSIAQAAFWQSVTEYNKSIADLHTRKGSIMEYNGIGFEEGPWPQKAYWDAMGRARERDAGTYIDYGWTRPKVISRGEIPQVTPGLDAFSLEGLPQGGAGSTEEVPTPEPTPAQPPKAGEGTLPEPMPLETRLRPLPTGKPKLSAAEPKREMPSAMSDPFGDEADIQPAAASLPTAASVTVKPLKPIAPATFQSGDSGVVNPLRSGR